LDNPYTIEIPEGKYIKCNRKQLERVKRDRGSSMRIGMNAGDIVIASQKLNSSFQFIELE
jgi:hypothetical protein